MSEHLNTDKSQFTKCFAQARNYRGRRKFFTPWKMCWT